MNKESIEERLKTLKDEYEAGQRMLADLDAKRGSLVQTLLRIEGAIQVLHDMANPRADGPDAPEPARPPVQAS